MTAALPISPRVLAALGAALALVFALLVARPLLLTGGDDTSSSTAVTPKPASVDQSPSTPKPAVTPAKPVKPQITLVAGLPKPIAKQLMRDRVAVVALYTRSAGTDQAAVRDARAGARAAGAAFVAIDLLNEQAARELEPLVSTIGTPAVLVFSRPGKLVSRFEGRVDGAIVQQAAHNAGARR